jgi:serine/threonine-protein kinase RsbW
MRIKEMVKILDDRTIELSLPNTMGYERIAMECSASLAKIGGFIQERIEDLKTIVAEACINAMQHGNKWRSDTRVTVTMNFKDSAIHVAVMDEGDGIENLPKDPDIERIIEYLDPCTGFGLFLIKKLADQVEFNAETSKGHVMRMVIRKGGR